MHAYYACNLPYMHVCMSISYRAELSLQQSTKLLKSCCDICNIFEHPSITTPETRGCRDVSPVCKVKESIKLRLKVAPAPGDINENNLGKHDECLFMSQLRHRDVITVQTHQTPSARRPCGRGNHVVTGVI